MTGDGFAAVLATLMWWQDAERELWSIARLATVSKSSKAKVAGALAQLLQLGYVEQHRGRWRLTALGRQRLDEGAPDPDELEKGLGQPLAADRRARLERARREHAERVRVHGEGAASDEVDGGGSGGARDG